MQHEDIEESMNTTVSLWELNITTKYSLQCKSEKHRQNPGEKRKGEKSDRQLKFLDYAKDKCQL